MMLCSLFYAKEGTSHSLMAEICLEVIILFVCCLLANNHHQIDWHLIYHNVMCSFLKVICEGPTDSFTALNENLLRCWNKGLKMYSNLLVWKGRLLLSTIYLWFSSLWLGDKIWICGIWLVIVCTWWKSEDGKKWNNCEGYLSLYFAAMPLIH